MPAIDPLNVAGIIIALIAALGAWATHRSSAKATVVNAKAAAELEAYGRAVNMDRETIKQQDAEILELRQDRMADRRRIKELEKDNEELHEECMKLRRRVTFLEEKR